MKNSIHVVESSDCLCSVCGRRMNDPSLERNVMYDIGIMQESEFKTRLDSFRFCWDCSKSLSEKLEEARYESEMKRVHNN